MRNPKRPSGRSQAHNGGVIFLGGEGRGLWWREGGRERTVGGEREGGREEGREGGREGGRDTLEYIYFDLTCSVLKKCNTIPIMTGMDDPTASTMPSTYHSHRFLPNLRFCLNAP